MLFRMKWGASIVVFLLTVLTFMGTVKPAEAQNPYTITYTWDGTFGGNFQGTISYYRLVNGVQTKMTDAPAYAGAFTATFNNNAPYPLNLPKSFHTYCVDLDHGQYVPGTESVDVNPAKVVAPIYKENKQYTDPATRLDVTNRLKQIAWLYHQYDGTVNATPAGQAQGVALQLAIWKILEDTKYTTGDTNVFDELTGATEGSYFTATGFGSALTIATDMLKTLGSNYSDNGVYLKVAAGAGRGDNTGQNMIMDVTPEGSSLAMLLLGGLPLLFGLTRLRRGKAMPDTTS